MSEPAIQVVDLHKRFKVIHQASSLKRAAVEFFLHPRRKLDPIEALRGVSFEVAQGETVGIIGRNGSGKSTILTLLAGIYLPSSGSITVRGRIGSLLEVAAGFHPEMTAEDNAILSAMIQGASRAEALQRLPSIIEFAGLAQFADAKMKHFSSGMYLRLGFSVVVHLHPDVLLVDEILAVGDEAFQRQCRETLRRLQEDEGKTIVFVSHDLDTIAEIASRVIWLDGGEVRMNGATDEVLAAYRSAATDPAEVRVASGE